MPKDESRTRTLRFLFLRMAKGLAAKDQISYESALRTLEIFDTRDGWEFSVTVNGNERSALVPKDAFSLYQTRQIQDSGIDPGVKNQMASLKVLFELFEDFDLRHHQYNPKVRLKGRDLFARNFGLINLFFHFLVGAFAIIMDSPGVIVFSLLTHLFGLFFLIKNHRNFVFYSIVFSCFLFLLFLGGLKFHETEFTISAGILIFGYFLERYFQGRLSMIVSMLLVFGAVLFLYFSFSKSSDLSPLFISLSALGLNIAVQKKYSIYLRLFGLIILLISSVALLFFGLLNTLWVLPFFLIGLLQSLLMTIIGNDKSVSRVLSGFLVFGTIQ
jgi:hypothetical protein